MPDLLAQLKAINLIKDLVVPAVAALMAIWLATRKFKKERLWQDKYSAYQRVLESIEAVRYWADEASSEVAMLPTIGWFNGKTSSEFYAEAKREISKQTTIGTLLLSEPFVEKLNAFQTDLFGQTHIASEDHHENEREAHSAFGDHATAVRSLADKYLPELLQLARKDLGA
jgi:hypothetical protein